LIIEVDEISQADFPTVSETYCFKSV